MFEVIQISEPLAAHRRLYGRLIDSADATSGKNITTTGVKALLAKNGVAFTSTADIVIPDTVNKPGEFYVELTQAEADTIGQYRGVVPKGTGYFDAPLQASIVNYDPYADGASVTTIAAGVRTNLATELAEIASTNTTVTAIAGYVDTEVAAIKVKTDLLSLDGSGGVSIAAADKTALLNTILNAVIETNGGVTVTVKQALQLAAALPAGVINDILAGAGTQTVHLTSASGQPFLTYTGDELGNRAVTRQSLS